MSIEELFSQLKNREDMLFLEAATLNDIKDFEHKNNIQLPKSFKDWLLLSDGGDLYLPAGVQFYGVSHKPLIEVDSDDSPDKSYVVIGSLSMGDPIVFKNGTEAISIYNHEEARIDTDETFCDFDSFLQNLPGIIGLEEEY